MSGDEMEEVLTDDEASAGSRAEFATCAACNRQWNLSDDGQRASILMLIINNAVGGQVFCGACVPLQEAGRVIGSLLRQLYEKGSENGDHVKEIARLREEVKSLQEQLNDQCQKSAQEISAILTQTRMRMQRTRKNSSRKDRILNWASEQCRENATENKCEICAQVCSKIEHELRRLRNSPDDPPSLLDRDSVHPISITDNSVVFGTVCGGLDEGDHIANLHGPKLAIAREHREAGEAEDDVTLEALAVPYDLQPVALQTNGLAQSN
jgi:hypothetical protein